ncbi:MAG: succinylglutamate desuccinylase/aspartoacylase family protein [Armatimonadota bacterium]|nr:succinylglutamate desuccinylase/aspartoacylase family protein [Armatimonadota bacterium]
MDEGLAVGTVLARPGQRVAGGIPVPGLETALPVVVVRGGGPGPTVCITAGVHGAEYVGIEAAIRTANGLDPRTLRGTVVVVPVANPPAFAARSIYVCPLDGKNLNRVFPGSTDGSASERIAHALFTEAISRADAHVDLHGGDLNEALVPFVIYSREAAPRVVARSRAMAEAFGLRYVVAGSIPGAAFAAAAAAGIPSILPEAGGQGVLDEVMVGLHLRGIRNVLGLLGMIPAQPHAVEAPVAVSSFVWVRSEYAGLFYPRLRVGAEVASGEPAGEIRDWYGQTLARLTSPASGVVLFVVTTPATNPGDPLFAIGVTG